MAFYTPVDNEEKRQMYVAMAREFIGTDHWYICVNGHPFNIGDCGLPMQTSACPKWDAFVAGQNYQPATVVTNAPDKSGR